MRIMALDYGDARIGVAMSDIMCIIANGKETYKRTTLNRDLTHFEELIRDNEVDTVVFGLPINMDGTEGVRVEKTREFAAMLAERCPSVKIAFQDERLTTVSAERALLEADMRRDKRKEVIDMVSAVIILQTYMECRR